MVCLLSLPQLLSGLALRRTKGAVKKMGSSMQNAKVECSNAPVGRLKSTGIKLKVIDKVTGKRVNYGVQLNNTTLEIEALPNLIVTIGYDREQEVSPKSKEK